MVIPAHRLGAGVRVWTRRAGRDVLAEDLTGLSAIAIPLDVPAARSVTLVGAKAANLAVAMTAGLPVIPGFAVPTDAVARAVAAGGFPSLPPEALDRLHAAWSRLTDEGALALVARSSARAEDAEGSSMAGRFHSVLEVTGWRAFLQALDEVAASASVTALDGTNTIEFHDMAIVVQRFLPAVLGGVLFGADPVTGRTDRLALATVAGGPETLVSGVDGGSQQVLSSRGRVLESAGEVSVAPTRGRVRELAKLAHRAAVVFGRPQDIEWAVDGNGRLWLLQSRPVTSLDRPASGPVLGPGPVAETFPDPLSTLEQDLWLEPLRIGIAHAIDITGIVSRRRLVTSPVAVAVGGRVAIDLGLIGAIPARRSVGRLLDPRPGARRLRAAWRTGRLRRAMPRLATELVSEVDRELAGVPALGDLTDRELLATLDGTRRALVALHGQEVLTGLLLHGDGGTGGAGAALALADLERARRSGVADEQITALHPAVLALVPPAIGPVTLPPVGVGAGAVERQVGARVDDAIDPIATLRESLRLRARWVQELGALAAWEVGRRLRDRGTVEREDDVRWLRADGLADALSGGRVTITRTVEVVPPLPTMFRLDSAGRPFAVADGAKRAGQGAGGGRRSGRVVFDPPERAGDEPVVLITQTLAPALAASLPGLAGLVSETGSVLSHLAILARELGIPTVVAVPDARQRFRVGDLVVVDGATGTVEKVAR